VTASVVISNLLYLVGALVLAGIGATIVVLRHRKPMSVEATMKTFNRGLRALAPEEQAATRRTATPAAARAGIEPVKILSSSAAAAEAYLQAADDASVPGTANTEAEAG
jgi:hypothetical protein